MMALNCIWQGNNRCGEGPVWHEREQAIYWLDIPNGLIQSLQLATNAYNTWQLPTMIGAFAFREQGGILAALRTGLAFVDLETLQIEYISQPLDDNSDFRFNDAKCDRAGRLFAGTMDMSERSNQGSLYRLEVDLHCEQVAQDYIIANGLGFSPDNRYFYHADSSRGEIYRYDYDINTGSLSNRSLWVDVPAAHGFSDGLCVDSEGYVWCGHWQGWRVVRYAPDGTIERTIEMPVANVTSCCFGGPSMTTLFITSAHDGQSPEQAAKGPLAGSLFALETGIKGLVETPFKG